MTSRPVVILAVSGMLVFGSLNTLTVKLQYTAVSMGAGYVEKEFRKPLFSTFTMFVGMAIVLFAYFASKAKCVSDDANSEGLSLNEDATTNGQADLLRRKLADFGYVAIPASFDLVGTCLMYIGLLFISASVWQLLRGAMVAFGAIISVVALGKQLYCYHWCGVVICSAGVVAVGTATMLNSSDEEADANSVPPALAALGMGLVLVAQLITASQLVAEEKLLNDIKLPAMKVVGYEGIWGCIMCIVVIFPLAYLLPGDDSGRFEDTVDSAVMISNSGALFGLVVLYTFSCATYNLSAMMVTSQLSAVHRSMVNASRTAGVWLAELFTYYFVDPSNSLGHPWTVYSWLQLFGFLLFMIGQLVYSAQIVLPGCYYPPPVSLPSSPRASTVCVHIDEEPATPTTPAGPTRRSTSVRSVTSLAVEVGRVVQRDSSLSEGTLARAESFIEFVPDRKQSPSNESSGSACQGDPVPPVVGVPKAQPDGPALEGIPTGKGLAAAALESIAESMGAGMRSVAAAVATARRDDRCTPCRTVCFTSIKP